MKYDSAVHFVFWLSLIVAISFGGYCEYKNKTIKGMVQTARFTACNDVKKDIEQGRTQATDEHIRFLIGCQADMNRLNPLDKAYFMVKGISMNLASVKG